MPKRSSAFLNNISGSSFVSVVSYGQRMWSLFLLNGKGLRLVSLCVIYYFNTESVCKVVKAITDCNNQIRYHLFQLVSCSCFYTRSVFAVKQEQTVECNVHVHHQVDL